MWWLAKINITPQGKADRAFVSSLAFFTSLFLRAILLTFRRISKRLQLTDMAEILGAVTSGVTIGALAGQIASSVKKMKSFLDEVKDAPENIRILLEDIEHLQLLLADIEDDYARNPYSELLIQNNSASPCLNHCKRGVEKLTRLVEEIDIELQDKGRAKRRLAGVKVVWRRDRVEKYKCWDEP